MNPNKIVWSEEMKKIKNMNFKDAAGYVWTYFKIPIIAIAVTLALGTFLAIRIATNIPDNWLMVAFVNTYADAGTNSDIWEDFTEFAGYDLSEKKVEFNASSYFDYLKNQARGNSYYDAFITYTDAGKLDAVTMSPESLSALGQSGRLMDLNDSRCADIKAKYGNRFVYYTPEQSSDEKPVPVPVGIDVSDSVLIGKYHIYSDSCALGIGAKSENIKEVKDFLDFILGES